MIWEYFLSIHGWVVASFLPTVCVFLSGLSVYLSACLLLSLVTVVLTTLFILMQFCLSIFSWVSYAFQVLSKNSLAREDGMEHFLCFPLSSLLDSTGGLCDLHGQQTVCRRKEGSSAQRDSVASAGSSFWSLPLSGIFKYSTIWWIILLTVNQILHAQLS